MWEGGGRQRRFLYATLASALVVSLFFGWYVTFGPGAWVSREPSAMQAMTGKSPARVAEPGATVSSVLAPPVASPSRGSAAGSASRPATEAAALALLTQESTAERDAVRLEGQWVAQLASKYVGIVDPLQVNDAGEHRFTARDIYAEHVALQSRITGARVLLLDSRTFGTRRSNEGQPYWVTVATDASFASADKIVTWCAAQFPELAGTALNNQCFATQIVAPVAG